MQPPRAVRCMERLYFSRIFCKFAGRKQACIIINTMIISKLPPHISGRRGGISLDALFLGSSFLRAASWIICFIGLAVPFFTIRIGINYSDEPYQIFNALDFRNAPATYLNGLVSTLWASVFGHGLLSMRVLMVLAGEFSVLLGAFYMYSRTRNIHAVALVTGVVSLLCNSYHIYCWGVMSNLSLMALFYCTLWVINHHRTYKYAVAGALAAVAALMRLPNVVGIVAVALVVLVDGALTHRMRRAAAGCCLAAGTFAVCYMGVMLAAFGSVAGFREALAASLVTNHSAALLIGSIFNTGMASIPVWCVMAMGAVMIYCADRFWTGRLALVAVSAIFAACLLIRLVPTVFEAYNTSLHNLENGLLVICLAWLFLMARRTSDRHLYVVLAAVLMFSVLPMAGSNVGFIKMMSCPMLPVVAAWAYPLLNRRVLVYIGTVVVVLAAIYMPVKLFFSVYEDNGFRLARLELPHPLLRGIYTSHYRADDIETLLRYVHVPDGERLVVESDNPTFYLGYYLHGYIPEYIKNEWENHLLDNPVHVKKCIGYLTSSQAPATVVMELKGLPDGAEPLLERELKASGCRLVESADNYRVFRYEGNFFGGGGDF